MANCRKIAVLLLALIVLHTSGASICVKLVPAWLIFRPWILWYAQIWPQYSGYLFTIVAAVLALYVIVVDFFGVDLRPEQEGLEENPFCADNSFVPSLLTLNTQFQETINLDTLIPQLCSRNAVLADDLVEIYSTTTRSSGITWLLLILSRKGKWAVKMLLESLAADELHPAHKELIPIVQKKYGNYIFSQTRREETFVDHLRTPPTQNQCLGFQSIGSTVICIGDIDTVNEAHSCISSCMWKGLKVHVPEGATASGSIKLQVHTCLSGQFKLPSDSCELMSAVYHITALEKQPASHTTTVELEHCAVICNPKDANCLTFIIANPDDGLPYRFEYLKGGLFTQGYQYGSICLSHGKLGLLAVVKQRKIFSSVDPLCMYWLQVFYTRTQTSENDFQVHFVITRKQEPVIQLVKERYAQSLTNLKVGPEQEISFERGVISLTVPDDGITLQGGWEITPLSCLDVTKQQVDNFTGDQLPHCKLQIKWTGSSEPTDFEYRMELRGSRKQHKYVHLQVNFASSLANILHSCFN